jgi:hypothetical protein
MTRKLAAFGVRAGRNYQRGAMVYGWEADINFSSASDSRMFSDPTITNTLHGFGRPAARALAFSHDHDLSDWGGALGHFHTCGSPATFGQLAQFRPVALRLGDRCRHRACRSVN